jgi:phage-related minor tail protein
VASLVGERGPELFIPKTAGTIIPNNSLAGAMGGGQTINYNGTYIANMSAIDTQSATQFLAKNKQTIWAVNQSAQRSLPVSK